MGTEEEIIANIRALICMIPCNNEDDASYDECNDDLNRACEEIENAVEDTAIALSMISDEGIFFETKRNFAKGYGNWIDPFKRNDCWCSCKPYKRI